MKVFKLSIIFLISALFITACNTPLTDEISYTTPNIYGKEEIQSAFAEQEVGWARENLDLRAVGELLEEADNAEELEYLLNSRNGVNNLDLNGDGYVDYISVREFDDRYDNERGFSLFSMFGPDAIQEILTVIFDRDGYGRNDDGYDEYGYSYPGSRVLLIGDDRIYGDDYYYEANWVDRPMPIVNWVFSDRDDYYRSPYYYGYYPDYYEPYTIVETTVYRTRVEEYYYDSTPAFVYTTQPTVTEIKIESPYRDRSFDRIYANLAKPTKEQVEFINNNPQVSEVVRVRKERMSEANNFSERPERPGKDFSGKRERDFSGNPETVSRDNPNRSERPGKFERTEKSERPGKFESTEKSERPGKLERAEQVRSERPQKQERPNKAERFENRSNPGRIEKQNSPRVEKQNSPRVERQQPQRTERPQPARVERPNQQRVERPQPNRVEKSKPQRTERPQPMKVERPNPPQVQRQSPPQQVQRQQPAKVERPKPQQENRGKPSGGDKPTGGGNGKGKGKP